MNSRIKTTLAIMLALTMTSTMAMANDIPNGEDVTVGSGAEYEIEYTGSVMLGPGFVVERGASFLATPSDY